MSPLNLGIAASGHYEAPAGLSIVDYQVSALMNSSAASGHVTPNFNVQNGDILVAIGMMENGSTSSYVTPSGGGLTWTARQEVKATSYPYVGIWTAPSTSVQSMAVTFTRTGTSSWYFGGVVYVIRNSVNGLGASAQNHVGSGMPTVSLTTTAANSVAVAAFIDYGAQACGTRVWQTSPAGSEDMYYYVSSHYTDYAERINNTGATGAKSLGLITGSTITTAKFSAAAIEIKP